MGSNNKKVPFCTTKPLRPNTFAQFMYAYRVTSQSKNHIKINNKPINNSKCTIPVVIVVVCLCVWWVGKWFVGMSVVRFGCIEKHEAE